MYVLIGITGGEVTDKTTALEQFNTGNNLEVQKKAGRMISSIGFKLMKTADSDVSDVLLYLERGTLKLSVAVVWSDAESAEIPSLKRMLAVACAAPGFA